MKVYQLDPRKFGRIRRNIILTYAFLALVALAVFYLYLRDALFGQAWMLIPFVLLLFAGACWLSIRDRKRYWDAFRISIQNDTLIYFVPKMPEVRLKRSDLTGVKPVRLGMILSTRFKENFLLIPKDLPDEDCAALWATLSRWVQSD